jgi:NAD+ diphosphatase
VDHHRDYGVDAYNIPVSSLVEIFAMEPASDPSRFEIVERAVELRVNSERLAQLLDNGAEFIAVWRGQNLFGQSGEGQPVLVPASKVKHLSTPIFLGLRPDGVGLFAVDVAGPDSQEAALRAVGLDDGAATFVQLREFKGTLSPEERSALLYSRALLHWHETQRFCSRCGNPTVATEGGHVMVCTNSECKHQYFPRSDPATIMLVHRPGFCLLGRQPSWPEAVYSTLAGFVEAGESAEQAVVREVKEESGIEIQNLRYFSSQPWPFPQSLMLGFFAEARTTEITCGSELADVGWFSVEETRNLLARLSTRFPHLDTIARRLIRTWLEEQREGARS